VQKPELLFDEEQEDHHRAPGNEEILQDMQEASGPSGNQVE
jgi:hypothetical protein